jgi:hypothetical protein
VDYDFPLSVWSALDSNNNLIYWGYAGTGHTGGRPNMILVYNYEKNRWTHANQQHYALVTSPPSIAQSSFWSFPLNRLLAFDANSIISFFAGAAGTATLISGEVEPQPGGCALVNGIKAIVSSSGTAPSIAVQVGSRDDQAAAVSYSATTAPTSRTGFSDFRSDARFHRARVYIAGNFDKALGLEIDATPTGGM